MRVEVEDKFSRDLPVDGRRDAERTVERALFPVTPSGSETARPASLKYENGRAVVGKSALYLGHQ